MNRAGLRVGNWFLDDLDIPRKIAYVGETVGLQLPGGGTQKYEEDPIISGNIKDLSPIPIAPYWMMKLKFSGAGNEWMKGGYKLELCAPRRLPTDKEVSEDYAGYKTLRIRGVEGRPIRYVHELQNIWYDLTEEEL